MMNSLLGSGNPIDPVLIFISFDPTGEWPWDYIAELSNESEEFQEEFRPLIDFSLSLRRNGVITRKEEDLERPRWNQAVSIRVELEMKIIQTFSGEWMDLHFDQYYHTQYRTNEFSMSFFPIAPGWKQPFSPLLKKLFSITTDQFEYYDSAYQSRANLISQYFATVFKNTEKPVTFIFLPADKMKKEYLLRWGKEIGIILESPELSEVAIPNHNGTIWLIPDADSAEIDYEQLREKILHILTNRNPSLMSKLKKFYGAILHNY